MKVLLIMPTSGYLAYPTPLAASDFPTGFAYIAAALKKAGHEVFGVNPNNDFTFATAYDMITSKIVSKLRIHDPDIICVGGICTEFNFIRDAIAIIRKNAPGKPIICGGGIINNDAEYIFDTLGTDFCIIGEGEEAIVRLLGSIETGRNDFDSIDNIGYRIDGKARFTKRNYSYPDIDERAFPDYEPFDFDLLLSDSRFMVDRNLYRYTRPKNPRPMPIVTARSCPFKCTFCVHETGAKYRARSINNIFEEIRVMYERYHFNILIIVDELFAANRTRLKELCKGIIKGKIDYGWDFDWSFQTHANAALDIESLRMSKSAGCYFFAYGIESASPRVLASMNKRTSPEQISEAIQIAKEAGLCFGGNYIFGDPAETIETIQESLDFVSLHSRYPTFMAFFGFIQAYPGSKLFKHCLEKGLIKDRLRFYEEGFINQINMTAIPDTLFISFSNALDLIGRTMRIGDIELVKNVKVTNVSVLPTDKTSPVNRVPNLFRCLTALLINDNRLKALLLFLRRRVARRKLIAIRETCPHCGNQIDCIEALNLGFINPFIRIGCAACNGQLILNVESAFSLFHNILGGILFKAGKWLLRFFTQEQLRAKAGGKEDSHVDIVLRDGHVQIITRHCLPTGKRQCHG